MNLAILGFNFQSSNYLVFDMDAKKALIMSKTDLKGHNILCANYNGETIKPLYPESKYFIPDLYSKTSPLLQGFLIDEVIPGKYSVYTNQMEIAVMTALQISKLYTILKADLTYPNGEIKVNILEQQNNSQGIYTGVPNITTTNMVSTARTSGLQSKTEELLEIFRKDLRGICIVTAKGWPMINQYKTKDILLALKEWIKQDYPELQTFFNYFLKYPMLYPVEGKTPLLQRRSYVMAMYRLLKAQITYTVAIKEIKQGLKVPSLPLQVRPLSYSFKWEEKLLAKLPDDQRSYLRCLANPKSIYHKNHSVRTTNACYLLGYNKNKKRIAESYTTYNDKLYKKFIHNATKARKEGYIVPIDSLDSVAYLEALATLDLHMKPRDFRTYCFIKIPTGGYLKLTRPRRLKDRTQDIAPSVSYVDRAETGVSTYDLGKLKFEGCTENAKIAELLLHYANRHHKHYEYYLDKNEPNHIYVKRISDMSAFDIILDGLSNVNELLEYMYIR